MRKSNIKIMNTYIKRDVIARSVYKDYIKNGVLTRKQGVTPTCVSKWFKQGFAPVEYHQSLLELDDLRGRVTADELLNDLRHKFEVMK